MAKPTAIVYIDGLNLQRRLVDSISSEMWVDYWRLAEAVLPNFELIAVRVFTTQETSPEVSAAKAIWTRQQQEYPKLSIHLGRMKKTTRLYPLAQTKDSQARGDSVKVIKYEEKGSDVALAAYATLDAAKGDASIYYLMTSDTDFEPLLRVLQQHLEVRVGVLCTTRNFPKLFTELKVNDIRHVKPKDVVRFL
jgi:uncharacterized LabA/DUF88 family protein